MIEETIMVTGDVQIKLVGPDGKIKQEQTIKNLVVTTGKQYIASRMTGTTTAMSHMAVGSGNTAAAAGDTALGAQLDRVALTSGTTTAAVTTYIASFPAGTGTGAITEAGVFNAASGGTMLCRTVFAVVNKGADDAMSITWQITVS
jgi:hypothetical protein